MAAKVEKKKNVTMHTIIGLLIMFSGFVIPPVFALTETGMEVIMIFLGTLYLWSTVEILWPSLFSVVMIGMSSYGAMGKVLSTFLGNGTVIQLMFTMFFTSALLYYGITKYIVNFCLSQKIVNGKPWAITSLLIFSAMLVGTFIGPFVSMFLFLPVMYDVYKQVGFKKEDAYVKITLVLVLIASLMGTSIAPYRGSVLSTLNFYNNMLTGDNAAAFAGQGMVDQGQYFLFTFIISVIMLIAILLLCKFVLRPNVTPLKEFNLEEIKKNGLPPMSMKQKILLGSLGVFLLWMLLPSFTKGIPFMDFLGSVSTAGSMTIVCILMVIKDKEGVQIINFQEVMSHKFSWPAFFLSATAIFYGPVLTADSVGLTETLEILLVPAFENVSVLLFMVLITILMVVLTNAANSTVMNMLLIPIALTYAVSAGISVVPIIVIITFAANVTAALIPAASAYSAILFGNTEWIEAKSIYKYSSIFIVVETVILLAIGIPLLNVIF